MLKFLIAIVLLAHGIGHSMGLLQVFRVATVNPQWHGDSWLLSNTLGPTIAQAAGVIAWTAAIIGFALLAAIVIGWLPESWFAVIAVASAGASLAGLALFPTAFPPFSSLGALAVNFVVLVAVFWYHWLPSDIAA